MGLSSPNIVAQPPLTNPVLDASGKFDRAWAIWFRDVYKRVAYKGGNAIDDNTLLIEGLQEQIDINADNIEANALAIDANSLAIAANVLAIEANALAILANTGLINDNAEDITELRKTFSWKEIPADTEVTIAAGQQMIVADGLEVEGTLNIDGELSLI